MVLFGYTKCSCMETLFKVSNMSIKFEFEGPAPDLENMRPSEIWDEGRDLGYNKMVSFLRAFAECDLFVKIGEESEAGSFEIIGTLPNLLKWKSLYWPAENDEEFRERCVPWIAV